MLNEEVRKYRYGQWAGNKNGIPYEEGHCAYEVWSRYYFGSRQCARLNGYGEGKLYCKQHARKLGML